MILRPFFAAAFDELLRLGRGRRERLFDEDVLAVLQGLPRQLVMGENRRDDGDDVHVLGPDEILGIPVILDEGIVGLRQAEALFRNVADRCQLDPRAGMEIPGHVGPPVPVADDSDVYHVCPLPIDNLPILNPGRASWRKAAGISLIYLLRVKLLDGLSHIFDLSVRQFRIHRQGEDLALALDRRPGNRAGLCFR